MFVSQCPLIDLYGEYIGKYAKFTISCSFGWKMHIDKILALKAASRVPINQQIK